MTWCWPNGVTAPYNPPTMGAGYGPRPPIVTPDGTTGNFHTGVDFKHTFTTVRSVGPGTVIYVGDRGTGNGLEVVVDHGTWISRYYHLASRAADIFVGLVVNGGRALGIMGDTGKAVGVHLHLRFDKQTGSATSGSSFDPVPLLVNLMRAQAGVAGGGTEPLPIPDDRSEPAMSTPVAFDPSVLIWPNGFASSYNAQVYAAMKSYIDAPDDPATQWVRDTYVRESWVAADYLIARQAKATTDSVIAALNAGGVNVAKVDTAEIVSGVLAALPAPVAAAVEGQLADDFQRVNQHITDIPPVPSEFEGTIHITPKEQA